MIPHARALLALLLLSLAACKSSEQKLVEKRRDLRATLDRLYVDYGGSGLAKETGVPESGLVGRFVAEVDRSYFEQQCLAIGRGERPFNVSEGLETFLGEPSHTRACRDAADLEIEVASLERTVAGAGGGR